MLIYYFFMILLAIIYIFIYNLDKSHKIKNWCMLYSIISGMLLFFVMGLKHYSVGVDWKQYIFRYENSILEFELGKGEWLYNYFVTVLKNIGVSNQGYIMIVALIISTLFTIFFYRYSKNIFLSFYLHICIGLFTMSMSGVRQTIAIGVILISFRYLIIEGTMKNFLKFTICVVVAYFIHNSAIVFLPVYFLKNIIISKKKGVIILLISCSTLIIREQIAPLVGFFMPERYYSRYELLTSSNPINKLLIITAILIPVACLLFWNNIKELSEKDKKIYYLLFIMACLNIVVNILSLNSNIIGRLALYFIPYNMVLIPNIITSIKNKDMRIIAIYVCIIFPIIQFSISTPNGTYQIDNYKFFWQENL